MSNPVLLDLPIPITTPRLLIRNAQAGDGVIIHEAIEESWDELNTWMDWAQKKLSASEYEVLCRQGLAKWILREDLWLLLFHRESGELVGCSGMHRMNWNVPSFEIGYWVRKKYVGQGFITESTNAISRYGFDELKAKRIEIRCDETNSRSLKVMEKLGFEKDALLKNGQMNADGTAPRNTLVYSMVSKDGLPNLEVNW